MVTNNYEIIFTDTAKEELEKIYEYISKHLYETSAAKRLMKKIEQNFLRLEKNPYSCMEVCVKPHDKTYRRLVIGNYIGLYDIDEKSKQVIIYRIFNGRMDYLNI